MNKSTCEAYLRQLEVIRILFFLVRIKSNNVLPHSKHAYKRNLKGAQRYLENIRGVRQKRVVGDLVAFDHVVKHWQHHEELVRYASGLPR